MTEDSSTPSVSAYLTLVASRWVPTGLVVPVLILLMQERGLTLGQIGLAIAMQGVMVFLLELPTGGLADTLGRRPVLLVAAAVELVAACILLGASGVVALAIVFALEGVYRALESGPLEAWFVSGYRPGPDDTPVGSVLARAGAVTGVALGIGSLLSGALVWWRPIDGVSPLAVPVAVAAVLRLFDLGLIALLMREPRTRSNLDGRAPVGDSWAIVRSTVALVRTSAVLKGLVAVEFCWGFGMVAFETLFPPRLADVAGGADDAASLLGPVGAVAWMVAAVGATVAPALGRRFGLVNAAMLGHAIQAMCVVGIAVVTGPVGVVAYFLAAMLLHGVANPLYRTILHEHADDARRTSVLSVASMAGLPGGAIGGIVLGALATATSVTVAMLAGAAMLALAVPMYLPARASNVAQDPSPVPEVA